MMGHLIFMPNRKRRDANQSDIVDVLKQAGATVVDLSQVGGGCPDILAGFAGGTYFIEIKNPATRYGKSGLTDGQEAFVDWWRGGPIYHCESVDDILEMVTWWRQHPEGVLDDTI